MKTDIYFLENSQAIGFSDVTMLEGATFTPSVSEDGIISWTNNKELPNPAPVSIKGEKGEQGAPGEDGEDGFSPEIYVQHIEGGHQIYIYSEPIPDHANSFAVMDGKDGEDGYTPEKGVDYWTDADKAEILAQTGEQWQLLCDTTTTEEVSFFAIDKDTDGNPFSCRKIVAEMILPELMTVSAQLYFGHWTKMWDGDLYAIGDTPWSNALIYDFKIELAKNDFAILSFCPRTTENFIGRYGGSEAIRHKNIAGISSLTKFCIINGYTEHPFPVGTRFLVWGCKA